MNRETLCGECKCLIYKNPTKPASGSYCPKMVIDDVFPNHSTLHTLESHGKELANPEDTCFEKKPLLTGFGEFTILELLAEIDERRKSEASI